MDARKRLILHIEHSTRTFSIVSLTNGGQGMTYQSALCYKNYFDENGIDAKNLNEKSNLMKDYDLDSLDYLELFDNLEEEFDIQVSDNMKDYNTLLSVDQLVQYVILNKKNVQN